MAGAVGQSSASEHSTGEAECPPLATTVPPQLVAQRLAALQALARRLSRPSSPRESIREAMVLAAGLLEADLWGSIHVVGGEKLVVKIHPAGRGAGLEHPARPAVHTVPLASEESLAGKAIRARGPISVKDLQLRAEGGDEFLHKLGVRAALVVPIFLLGEPYGAVALYRRQPRPFSPDQIAFFEAVASCVATAIARAMADEALGDQREFVSVLLETIDNLVLVLDVDGNVEGINRACRELSGFALPEIRGKPFCSVFAVPGEVELFRKTFRRAVNNKQGCRFESALLAKDGTRHCIAWSLKLVVDRQSFVQAILLTGTDQTKYMEVCRKLEQAEAVARETSAAVRELRRQLAERPLRRLAGRDASQAAGTGSPSAQPADGVNWIHTAPAPGAECRRSPRHPYRYRQLIAPLRGEQMPAAEDFFAVECADISAGGLSFYHPQRPDFHKIVVALGQVPFLTHFKAEVVRVVDQSNEAENRFLVGCRFTGRVYH